MLQGGRNPSSLFVFLILGTSRQVLEDRRLFGMTWCPQDTKSGNRSLRGSVADVGKTPLGLQAEVPSAVLLMTSHQCCYMLCSQNWCFYYKCKLRPSCKGSGQLGPLLEGCYRTIPHATWSILLTTEAKEYTDMCLHWWDISLSRLLVYLYLSSHQLHKSSFTVIKSRGPCFTFSRLHYTIISALRIKSSYKI